MSCEAQIVGFPAIEKTFRAIVSELEVDSVENMHDLNFYDLDCRIYE
jgi:hypothetical protein